jgi:membrane fusion protein (multidrug efflux system)
MKKLSSFIVLSLLVVACSQPSGDKKTQLAELKKQKTELEAKIKELEKEVSKEQSKPAQETRIKSVVVVPVGIQTFKHYLEVQGTLGSDQNINVTARMGGTVTQVLVKEGTPVSAGQVLAITDDATLRQNMAQLQTGYELVKTLFERQDNLWKQKIGSEVQYLQAKNQKESLERQIATLNTQIAMTRITSPISGTIDAVYARVGELAAPGAPAFRVVNLSAMKVQAKVADTYINDIRRGDPVNIRFPDIDEEVNTRISFVGQVVNPSSRTFDIEITLPNPKGTLKPNLLSVININDKTLQNVLVIDENLIQRTELGAIVYVAVSEGGKTLARSRKVSTGLSYKGNVVITEGLQAGDQLITIGNQDLVDGQSIKVEQPVAKN